MYNFERGKSPKRAMGIGLEEALKKSVEKMIEQTGSLLDKDVVREAWEKKIEGEVGVKVELIVKVDEISKFWSPLKLIVRCQGLKDMAAKIDVSHLPPIQKVAAQTMARHLTPVSPIPSLNGSLYYKYKRNRIQRLMDKIKYVKIRKRKKSI